MVLVVCLVCGSLGGHRGGGCGQLSWLYWDSVRLLDFFSDKRSAFICR